MQKVTIIIPAYNEEANIANLLQTIVLQNISGFKLNEIVVVCDGCDDGTEQIARTFANTNKMIRIVSDGKRLGKNTRIKNEVLISKSDIIVIFDADTMLSDNYVLSKMVLPFNKDNVGMVCANNVTVKGNGIVNILINSWVDVWYDVKRLINKGNNVHNVRSCCLAARISFLRNNLWPDDIISVGRYLYFACKKVNLDFKFIEEAKVYYRNPESLADYVIQKKRAVSERRKFENQFGGIVKEEYNTPFFNKVRIMSRIFIKKPLKFAFALIFRIFFLIYKKSPVQVNNNQFWKVAESTKKGMDITSFQNLKAI